jgi:SAM-dependent methyltransferase
MLMIGIDPLKVVRFIRGMPFYLHDRKTLVKQQRLSNVHFPFGKTKPILNERFTESGKASGHYFHQDLLVARTIFINQPSLHVDIGSRVDGFVAHVASFRKIEVFDIRKSANKIPNISFVQADLMGKIDNSLTDYTDSLSCLHALEHFGLGRYGDPVKYEGYLDGLNNLTKILKRGGKLYLSVPIGPQRIEFNAHRVFSLPYLIELFESNYDIDTFSYVDDEGDLHENISLGDKIRVQSNYDCNFGCGIFELTKR